MIEAPEIRPGQSIELLKALHILTREGRMNQDSRRKLKQIYHLYQLIEPLLTEALERQPSITLVDHGAGKSYLGFILYDLFFKPRAGASRVFGIETRADLVESARSLALASDFSGMAFLNLSIEAALTAPELPPRVEVVTALHACDTATDDALRFALARNADSVVLVPCCQAEVAAELRRNKGAVLGRNALAELWRHPLHTREFGSQLTNVLRCLLLEAHGYQVTVTELVGWEHSMKNELIIARQRNLPGARARSRLDEILDSLGLDGLRARFGT